MIFEKKSPKVKMCRYNDLKTTRKQNLLLANITVEEVT